MFTVYMLECSAATLTCILVVQAVVKVHLQCCDNSLLVSSGNKGCINHVGQTLTESSNCL